MTGTTAGKISVRCDSVSPAPYAPFVAAIKEGLGQTGFVEGRNIAIEYRWAEGHYDRLPQQAAELVARGAQEDTAVLTDRFPVQPVNDVLQGLLATAPGGAGFFVNAQLLVRARSAFQDYIRSRNLFDASESLRIVSDPLHRLIDEGGRREVTLPAPLVLTRNGSCNRSQFGIEIRLLDEMSNEAAEQRSDAQRVLDVRADVRDPQLESWVLQRGADDPPDVAGILDHAGCNKGVDVVLVLRERLEQLWKARARKLVVGGETVATQAGPMSLPERRGGAERQ